MEHTAVDVGSGTTPTGDARAPRDSCDPVRSSAQADHLLLGAVSALAQLDALLGKALDSELGHVLGLLDRLCAASGAARVAVTTEAVARGLVDTVREAGTWVGEHAPSTQQDGTARAVAAVACRAARVRGWGSGPDSVGPVTDTLDSASPFGVIHGAVAAGELKPRSAWTALGMMDRLVPHVRPEMLSARAQGMVTVGRDHGAGEMGRLKASLVAEYGREGENDQRAEELARAASMSSPIIASDDLTEYRLFATPEQSATLEAAIGPLSSPAPNPETGERDSRSAGQRRIEALVTVLGRYTEQAADAAGGAAGARVALHVTMPLAHLIVGLGRDASTRPGGTTAEWAESLTLLSDASIRGSEAVAPDAVRAALLGAAIGEGEVPRAGAFATVDVDADVDAVADAGVDAAGPGSRSSPATRVGRAGMSRAAGTQLAPGTIRRLACEAEIIPTVLGTRSEILDIAVPARLFPRGQKQLLWQRDRHCTYPGCDAPPAWCEAHHVLHWLDGGPTRTSNAALLCSRHHRVVHSRRLWAEVREQPDEGGRYVIWHLTPGSYDRAVAARASLPEPA